MNYRDFYDNVVERAVSSKAAQDIIESYITPAVEEFNGGKKFEWSDDIRYEIEEELYSDYEFVSDVLDLTESCIEYFFDKDPAGVTHMLIDKLGFSDFVDKWEFYSDEDFAGLTEEEIFKIMEYAKYDSSYSILRDLLLDYDHVDDMIITELLGTFVF